MTDEESGLDELMRLSRQFTKQQEENDKAEQERIEQGKKVQGVLQGLKDLNVSMSLSQLNGLADEAIIKRVENLKQADDAEDLRKLLSTLADDLERQLGTLSASRKEIEPLVNTVRTLNILMDLYFSLN